MSRKIYLVLVLTLLLCAAAFLVLGPPGAPPPNLLRLHVIANSNLFYDQELKYRVKESIVRETAQAFAGAASAGQAREIADANLEKIARIARREIKNSGFDYPVQVTRGYYYFPTKTYNLRGPNGESALTLPAGRYEAVRVVIGSGRGANWWCVLYPPLCFVDGGHILPPAAPPTAPAVHEAEKAAACAGSERPHIAYRLRIAELWRSIWRSEK